MLNAWGVKIYQGVQPPTPVNSHPIQNSFRARIVGTKTNSKNNEVRVTLTHANLPVRSNKGRGVLHFTPCQ